MRSPTQKTRAPSVDATHGNVITCPLSGGQPAVQNYGQNGYADQHAPPTSYQGTVFTPQQNPSLIPSMAQQQVGGHAGNQPTFQTQLPQAQFNTMPTQSFGLPPSSMADQTTTRIATPELPKAKAPIPEEYVYLQTVLNELKIQCINTATNPVRCIFDRSQHSMLITAISDLRLQQIKRKLDDVGKRLESLYDLLREYRVSSTLLKSPVS